MALLDEIDGIAAEAWQASAPRCVWCGELITRWETYRDGTQAGPNLWTHEETQRITCAGNWTEAPFATPPAELLR